MKKIIYLLVSIVFMAVSCKSTSKLIEEGNYDRVIEKNISKILKGKYDVEDVEALDKAYKLANLENLERINLLQSEGKPENWERIYYQYVALDNRQREVRKILPLKIKGRVIDYEQKDYTPLLVESKSNAAKYFYDSGIELMNDGSKMSYRQAYAMFTKARDYRSDLFPDINQLKDEAFLNGKTRVLYDVINNTDLKLTPDFYDKILSVNTSRINSQWVEYHIGRSDRLVDFDYYITVYLQAFIFEPEQTTRTEYTRKKEIEDGFTYVLDKRGNVMKDSLGNDIKTPKYKTLECLVVKSDYLKVTSIEAQVEYLELYPNRRVVKLIPLKVQSVFDYSNGRARGDQDALLPEDLELIKKPRVSFPDDISMVYDCADPLLMEVTRILEENKRLVQ